MKITGKNWTMATTMATGELVAMAIRGLRGHVAWARVNWLAKTMGTDVRHLIRCHDAYLVRRLAGAGLAVRLPLCSFDAARQLSRILRADGSLPWKQRTILAVAEASRDVPAHEVGGLVDKALAGDARRRRWANTSRGRDALLADLADDIEFFVAEAAAAA